MVPYLGSVRNLKSTISVIDEARAERLRRQKSDEAAKLALSAREVSLPFSMMKLQSASVALRISPVENAVFTPDESHSADVVTPTPPASSSGNQLKSEGAAGEGGEWRSRTSPRVLSSNAGAVLAGDVDSIFVPRSAESSRSHKSGSGVDSQMEELPPEADRLRAVSEGAGRSLRTSKRRQSTCGADARSVNPSGAEASGDGAVGLPSSSSSSSSSSSIILPSS